MFHNGCGPTAANNDGAGAALAGGGQFRHSEFEAQAQRLALRFGITHPHARTVLKLLRGEAFA